MTAFNEQVTSSSRSLMPHQRAFVESVFVPGAKRVHWLSAAPGSGKSTALIAAAQRVLSENPLARLLILTPAALGTYFAERLRPLAIPILRVDRYRFRELRNASADQPMWPEGSVVVLSLDFAKQLDIRVSLVSVHWDMVIVDGGSKIRDARAEVITMLADKAEHVIVATDVDMPLDDLFPPMEASVVHWRREDLVDHAGKSLVGLRPSLTESTYSLTAAELALVAHAEAICTALAAMPTAVASLRSVSLRKQLESSPAALESGLRTLSISIEPTGEHALDLMADEVEGDDLLDDSLSDPASAAVFSQIVATASQVLTTLDELNDDSKLAAFLSLIRTFQSDTGLAARVAVVTKYASTLFYLAAALEDLGIPVLPFHSGMDVEAQVRSLQTYSDKGGLLLATYAALQGFEFPETRNLVLYEVPNSRSVALSLVGVNRFRSNMGLNVHLLLPKNWEYSSLSPGLNFLREITAQ